MTDVAPVARKRQRPTAAFGPITASGTSPPKYRRSSGRGLTQAKSGTPGGRGGAAGSHPLSAHMPGVRLYSRAAPAYYDGATFGERARCPSAVGTGPLLLPRPSRHAGSPSERLCSPSASLGPSLLVSVREQPPLMEPLTSRSDTPPGPVLSSSTIRGPMMQGDQPSGSASAWLSL